MYGTIIQRGNFTSTGAAVNLDIRSDFDSIHVWNLTVMNNAALGSDWLQEGLFLGLFLPMDKELRFVNSVQLLMIH